MMTRYVSLLRTLWRSRRRTPDLPRFLTYIVTFTCNARCIMCDSWKKPSRDALTLDEIERIFRQLPVMDVVRLTGGEPFVRRDLMEIANLAETHLQPLFLHLTTNGFLTDDIVRFCEQRARRVPLHLLVSVDGIGDKHNAVRGTSQAWSSVMETLNALAPRQEELGLHLAVNQTIVDAEGAEHYRQLRDVLAPLGVHNQMVMAYDVSATYSLEPHVDVAPKEAGAFSTFGEFTRPQLEHLLDDVEQDITRYPFLERWGKRYYLHGMRQRLLHGRARPNPPCVALNAHMRLMPNGDVPTCQFNTTMIGNLRHQTFRDVWLGRARHQQREWVTQCPGCWAECEVLPNAIYSGDLVRSLPIARRACNS